MHEGKGPRPFHIHSAGQGVSPQISVCLRVGASQASNVLITLSDPPRMPTAFCMTASPLTPIVRSEMRARSPSGQNGNGFVNAADTGTKHLAGQRLTESVLQLHFCMARDSGLAKT